MSVPYAGWGAASSRKILPGRGATFRPFHFSIGSGSQLPLISSMRSRAIIVVSLVANLVLAAGWFWTSQRQARRFNRAGIVADAGAAPLVKTSVLVRKQVFTRHETESSD